jgi:hypothetical protein
MYSDMEHEVCKGPTSITPPAAVWKLDLTMQKLGGSLSDDVIDALKVLTGHGLQAIDFSRYAAAAVVKVAFWANLITSFGITWQLRCMVGVCCPSILEDVFRIPWYICSFIRSSEGRPVPV